MNDSIVKQIGELQSLTTQQLKERWKTLFRKEPPEYSRAILIKRLAYRIQEIKFGGVSLSIRKKLNDSLTKADCDQFGIPRKKFDRNLPVVGTRLIREWQGKRYEVTVCRGGFEYNGKMYRSLTSVAKTITGSQWNGPAFFGLRTK
ncbi:MAG: DUF2924 domain-containing protein [Candidatus Auribacter fodinae]|jgi:hypothetical protein|uniref:DUF2924 domain-containing protein n=1 Tax=Candidatus Auribacter fodinae TaxID=2093366 RepID=A0A3A4RDW2_9BACT|nr:MAG: DUF2924 domain-containing protein [Candidatus Auribacter fodinae]